MKSLVHFFTVAVSLEKLPTLEKLCETLRKLTKKRKLSIDCGSALNTPTFPMSWKAEKPFPLEKNEVSSLVNILFSKTFSFNQNIELSFDVRVAIS
eukprot:snap_masked-scaffold_6-processed-gene-11.26-mRNA-1 protein AED:1.00 eAED:1.00 QI:0/0/0/0/1/1/2/0/95